MPYHTMPCTNCHVINTKMLVSTIKLPIRVRVLLAQRPPPPHTTTKIRKKRRWSTLSKRASRSRMNAARMKLWRVSSSACSRVMIITSCCCVCSARRGCECGRGGGAGEGGSQEGHQGVSVPVGPVGDGGVGGRAGTGTGSGSFHVQMVLSGSGWRSVRASRSVGVRRL
ncbi:hypothetical protein P167DRAFT_138233 [Morchella conica CCBAS932]|uniref:Uncharacterized protein n=1 Tax=Morchella conica CCBAS932 TaxID=1392247 RepID=A0A3N4KDM3_9PEZI|nr:hypothetical protein P167DRAFT_138233 [Morchella conica CCBAS932]